jgi:hypothetical protein
MAKDVTNALNSSFSVSDKKIVTRNSVKKYNNQVAGAMCRLAGYDGYITKEMKGHNVNTFHPEIVLCNPAIKLKLTDNRQSRKPSVAPTKRPTKRRFGTPKTSPKTSPIRRLGTPKTSPIRRLGTPKTSPRTPRTSRPTTGTPPPVRRLGF